MPAVVNVSAVQKAARREGPPGQPPERFREFFGEEFYERFFRRRPESRNQGSGVLVDRRGLIVTNNHLIEGSDEIEVRLSDKRKFPARVVGRDPKTDVAVLKIDAEHDLPVAELGDSDRLRIGQWAIAVGNPFGLDSTVTVGIISATGRARVGVTTYEDFIQTDAAINPGNSGGPLLNLDGKVVGINTAIVSVGQGIGFAIPVNMVKAILPQLVAGGKVTRGWLGIRIQELTEELAPSFGLPPRSGVLVSDVMPGSPAEGGGLRAGDLIVAYGEAPVTDVPTLQRLVAATAPGQLARITVVRDGGRETLAVTIGEQPAEAVAAVAPPERWGLTVEPLTPELAREFNLSAQEGVLVFRVAAGSPADRAGLRPGDAILEVNRRKVADPDAYQEALGRVGPSGEVLLYVQRAGRGLYLVMRAAEGKE
ncbi:MAG: DegQ family serine endoprotease [Candidatus Rokubacteria bacterium]|nr:DegQ family serine endoprotease [Candidatus Rokubacteria bacterium]